MQRFDLKENIRHGEALFPLCVYPIDNRYTQELFPCHWHEEMEIIQMQKGRAIFQLNGNPVELCQGQMLCVAAGELHTAYAPDDVCCELNAVVFDRSMLGSSTIGSCQSRYVAPLINNQYYLPQVIPGSSDWERQAQCQIAELVKAYLRKEPAYELVIKACLYRFLSILIANQQLSGRREESNISQYKVENLKRVLLYIQDHYAEKVSIADLADEISMSKYHFCRFFKAMMGHTPIEYVNTYRVDRATSLLRNGELKIMDIAMEAGFENFSYFIRTFKLLKGCTPSEFRRRML
jgi:AraC-like DNA-binding protein